jgi:hypothetical protein
MKLLFPLPQVRSNNSGGGGSSTKATETATATATAIGARAHGPARPVMGSVQYMARPKEGERAAAACDLLVGGAVYADWTGLDGVAQCRRRLCLALQTE